MRKNVLFIAKFDNILKGTNAILAKMFNMQMCPPDSGMVEKTIEVMEIDLILLYISNLSKRQMITLCNVLDKVYAEIPIVVFGTSDECDNFRSCCHFHLKIGEYLYRPVSATEIAKTICALLGLEIEPSPPSVIDSNMSIADFAATLETDERRCILLVDDSAVILRAMQMILEKDYRVNIANSAMIALESIKHERPDAILLDYEMPIHNGKQMLEMIRENDDTKNLPVFFLTGVSDGERVKDIVRLKPQGYFLKNSDQSVILEALDKYFKGLSE